MPLCVYCDTAYPPGDRSCSTCGLPTELDSPYPVIAGELVLVECPVCRSHPVIPLQLRCPSGCDLTKFWDLPVGGATKNSPSGANSAQSRPIERSPQPTSHPTDMAGNQDVAVTGAAKGGNQNRGQERICASCQTSGRAGDRFCGRCGAPMSKVCPACGKDTKVGATSCGGCGVSLLDDGTDPPSDISELLRIQSEQAHDTAVRLQPDALSGSKARFELAVLGADGTVLHRFALPDGDHLVGAQSLGEGIHPEIDLSPFDPDHYLSRQHAILRVDNDKVYVADHPGSTGCGSTNGTWFRGRRVPTSMIEVVPDAELVFGKLKSRIVLLTVPPT